MFEQYHNFLSAELLKTLQDTYMNDQVRWTHRDFGRFFCYFNENHHEQIVEELYNNENLPTYHNNKMMRHHHMYLQRFVPGSWLPLHRERCYGVLTIYINPDEDWNENNPAPKFIYYTTQDLHNLEAHKNSYDIHCNSGTYFLTTDDSKAPEYNAYHKVEYNESNTSRYAVQMFFGPAQEDFGTMSGNSNTQFRNFKHTESYTDTNQNQTLKAITTGALQLPELGQLVGTREEWNRDNAEIIQRLEQDG